MNNVAHGYGKTATFMPKPLVGDNGSGMHVHQSISKGGKNLFPATVTAACPRLALYYIGGIIKHARAMNAIHELQHELVQAPGAGLRSAGDARLLGAQPFRIDPHSVHSGATRRPAASRSASRTARRTRTSRSPR